MPTTNIKRQAKSRDLGVNNPVKIPLMPAIFPLSTSMINADSPSKMPPDNDSQGTTNAI
jgi:hypothetical protein